MQLQIIRSLDGKDEYVLLPVPVFMQLRQEIEVKLAEFVPQATTLTAYITNPVEQARINANMTQQELAQLMGVSQAYISKLEKQERVSAKMLAKVETALSKINKY